MTVLNSYYMILTLTSHGLGFSQMATFGAGESLRQGFHSRGHSTRKLAAKLAF